MSLDEKVKLLMQMNGRGAQKLEFYCSVRFPFQEARKSAFCAKNKHFPGSEGLKAVVGDMF